jgi:TP901 family phage tail tape measure protein
MAVVSAVEVEFSANTAKLEAAIKKVQSGLNSIDTKKMESAGRKMTVGLTAPMTAVGIGAVKMASDFDASMAKIQSLVGQSADQVEGYKKTVMELSGETARAPKELADALFFITSAGLEGEEALDALEMSAKAAASGLGETEVVANAVTNAMNGYGSEAINAAQATDILAKTVEQGKASAADLAPTFGRLVPMAAELGVEFDELGGGMAFLTRATGDASIAATGMQGILKTIIKPSQEAKDALEQIGWSADSLKQAAEEDLHGALMTLRGDLEANGLEMSNVFVDAEALKGALQLTGNQAEIAAGVFEEVANAAGKTDEAFKVTTETSAFKMQQAMNQTRVALIELGGVLMGAAVPAIEALGGALKKASEFFQGLPGPLQTTVVVIGGLVAAAGPLLIITAKLVTAYQTLTASIGAKRAAMAADTAATGASTAAHGGLLASVRGLAAAHPAATVAVGAAAVAAVGLGLAMRDAAKDAAEEKKRMEQLRQEWIDDDKAAATLVTKLREMAEELGTVGDEMEETGDSAEKLESGLLANELANRNVVAAMEEAGITMEDLNSAVETGSDEWNKFSDGINWATSTMFESEASGKAAADTIRNELGDSLSDVTETMLKAVENGSLTVGQFAAIAQAADETADANDNLNKTLEKEAENFLTSGEAMAAFGDQVGASYIEALIAAGEAGEGWQEQLDALNAQLELQAGRARQAEALNRAYGLTTDDAAESTEGTADAMDGGAEAADGLAGSIKGLTDETRGYSEILADLTDAHMSQFEAQIALDEGAVKVGEAFRAAEEATLNLTNADENLRTTQADVDAAMRDAMTAANDQAKAVLDLERATAAANDETLTATQENNILADALEGMAQYMTGPAKQAILDHAADLRDIPEDARTDVGLTGVEAAEQAVAGHNRNLDSIARNITTYLHVAPGQSMVTASGQGFATGGRVARPTFSMIGEGGFPEYVIPTDPKYQKRAVGLMAAAAHEMGLLNQFAAGGRNPTPGVGNPTPGSKTSPMGALQFLKDADPAQYEALKKMVAHPLLGSQDLDAQRQQQMVRSGVQGIMAAHKEYQLTAPTTAAEALARDDVVAYQRLAWGLNEDLSGPVYGSTEAEKAAARAKAAAMGIDFEAPDDARFAAGDLAYQMARSSTTRQGGSTTIVNNYTLNAVYEEGSDIETEFARMQLHNPGIHH